MAKPRVIDIFAGCGGLSLGLHQAGFKGLFAIEKSEMAFETLSHNLIKKQRHFEWPKWLPVGHHDIDEVLAKYRRELTGLAGSVDLVVGGPPCQGFSTAGRRRESDARNKLIHSYVKFVELVKPTIVLFENVTGFTRKFGGSTGKKIPYSQVVVNQLKKLGYADVMGKILKFSEFGVPQGRERFIIVGTLLGTAPKFFATLSQKRFSYLQGKGLRTNIGVQAAISDLRRSTRDVDCPDSKGFKSGRYRTPSTNYQKHMRSSMQDDIIPDSHRFVNHRKSTTQVFKKILKCAEPNVRIAGKERENFGVKKRNVTLLASNLPSPTLMSIPDDYVHYCEPRILTVREYARIQSFPDSFEFKGPYTTGGKERVNKVPRYTQIGNAVPPLFAELAGEVLKEMLSNGKARSD